MITVGEAQWWHQNINVYVGFTFVVSVSLALGLIIWHAAYDKNPVADLLAEQLYTQQVTR